MPIHVTAAIIINEDKTIFAARRGPGKHLAGLWEFPGGKVERDETPPAALIRELEEELGVRAEALEPTVFSFHEYTERRVLILFTGHGYQATVRARSP